VAPSLLPHIRGRLTGGSRHLNPANSRKRHGRNIESTNQFVRSFAEAHRVRRGRGRGRGGADGCAPTRGNEEGVALSRHCDAISVINASVGAGAPRDKKRTLPPATVFPPYEGDTHEYVTRPLWGVLFCPFPFRFLISRFSSFSSRVAARPSRDPRENLRRKNQNLSPSDSRRRSQGGLSVAIVLRNFIGEVSNEDWNSP